MKKSILSIVATFALAGMANAGNVIFSNFSGSFSQVQAEGVAIPAGSGFVAVGTTSIDAATAEAQLVADVTGNGGQLSTDGLAFLDSIFVQFGNGVTFGFEGNDGYFEGLATGDGGAAAFLNNPVYMIAGNGADVASSTSLLIIKGDDNFSVDNPLFSSNVNPDSGTILFGAAGGTNSLSEALGAVQMGNVGDIIPEPGVSILALLSAGIIFLRRRR